MIYFRWHVMNGIAFTFQAYLNKWFKFDIDYNSLIMLSV